MKLVGLLSYFDESPEWLYESIVSLSKLPVTDLVVLDGPYDLYPAEEDASPPECYEAIEQACADTGILLHYFTEGRMSEVKKRARLFALGEKITTKKDWYMVIDADERVTHIDGELTLKGDVATATLIEPDTSNTDELRIFFRAQRGLTVKDNHYHYLVPGRCTLWASTGVKVTPACKSNVVLDHLTNIRSPERFQAARDYYTERDRNLIETFACAWCGVQTSIQVSVPMGWEFDGDSAKAQRQICCKGCLPQAKADSQAEYFALTGNPISIVG